MVASKILGLTSILGVVVTSSSLLGEEEPGEGESVDTDVSVSVVDGRGAGKSELLKTKASATMCVCTGWSIWLENTFCWHRVNILLKSMNM